MTDEFEIVIAGAGIAGLTAALYSARLGRKTLLLTGHVPGGHLLSINKIDGFPGFPEGIAGYDLCPMAQDDAISAGAELVGSELQKIEQQDGQYLVTTSDNEYVTNALILATGSSLKELGIPGEEQFRGKGVSHCASCDAPVLGGKVVAVVGGGDSALQEALTLADFASEVIILHRGETLSAQNTYQKQVQENPKINIRFNSMVEEILGDEAVTAVKIQDANSGVSENLEVSAVFVYVGMQPNTDKVADLLQLDESGQIPTDSQMRTELKGLLAAGIIRSGSPGQAVSSAGDGTTAAKTADRYLADNFWR